jgi:septal ring-binding cell division protein DamX
LSFDVNGFADFYGKTKDLKVFKRAMSDGELYLLTVPQYQSYQEMATALNYTL